MNGDLPTDPDDIRKKRAVGTKINAWKLKQRRKALGKTQAYVAAIAEMGHRTYERIEAGEVVVDPFSLSLIAECLDLDQESLVRPLTNPELVLGSEWNIDRMQRQEKLQKLANGLRYEIYSVSSTIHADRRGRAKLYDESYLSTDDSERIDAILSRHSEIAYRLRHAPNIARHITSGKDEQGDCWWVLDEWVEGKTLAELFKYEKGKEQLAVIMKGIADGLAALHAEDIILRNLSPKSVTVGSKDGIPVLSDFELGKLLEGVPTVSPEEGKWKKNPYLANEVIVGAGDVGFAADWYSWGMLLLEGLGGDVTAGDQQRESVVLDSDLPEAVKKMALKCLKRPATDRPNDAKKVLRALKSWK